VVVVEVVKVLVVEVPVVLYILHHIQ